MDQEVTGSCLCNEVRFKVTGPYHRFALCHCSRCRKSTGSAHASNIFTDVDHLTWLSGESLVKRFRLPSAKRFSKAFCSMCGTPVPCVSRDGKRVVIPAGSLDSDPQIKPDVKIYCADTAPWYKQLESVEAFDGPPR
jgi:hypothetical protein